MYNQLREREALQDRSHLLGKQMQPREVLRNRDLLSDRVEAVVAVTRKGHLRDKLLLLLSRLGREVWIRSPIDRCVTI